MHYSFCLLLSWHVVVLDTRWLAPVACDKLTCRETAGLGAEAPASKWSGQPRTLKPAHQQHTNIGRSEHARDRGGTSMVRCQALLVLCVRFYKRVFLREIATKIACHV